MAEVPGTVGRLRALCASMGVGHADATVFEICATEAINNVIEHAYGGKPGNTVSVVVTLSATTLTVQVTDDGVSLPAERLETAHAPEPDLDDLDSLPERGMGLAILKEAMDDVSYQTLRGKNTLTLRKQVSLTGSLATPGE